MKKFNAIIAEMRKDYYKMGRSNAKLDTDLMDMLRSFADQLVPSYASEMDALLVGKNAEIDTLKDQVSQLVEMQNPDIQVQKAIALEKRLNEQKAINKNLVDQNAELLADLKRSNEQYQHLVNVKSCEWDDNRKPDLITMCEKLHRAIKDERTAAFAAQTAYATRREIEDAIVDLVGAIIETRIQKEENNDHT